VRKSLQIGMRDLVQKKLSTDEINVTFLRWLTSIERTAKSIIRKKNPLPPKGSEYFLKEIKVKKDRDSELELFLRKSSF